MTTVRCTSIIATLLLAGCAGGQTLSVPPVIAQASVRFVNSGSVQPVDIYFQQDGFPLPSTPVIAALPNDLASDFATLPAGSGTVYMQTAGGAAPSTGNPQFAACSVPSFAVNEIYSIVLVEAGGMRCELFHDAPYTGNAQYRFHDATVDGFHASFGATFGAAVAPALPGASFAVQGNAPFGNLSTAGTGFTQVPVTTLASTSNVSFAAGGGGSDAIGSAQQAGLTLDASFLALPGRTTEPNAGNTFAPPTGYVGASLYEVLCSSDPPQAGSHCQFRLALIGVFDSR